MLFGRSAWPPFTNPGRTYKFYTGKPVLPFGYGLSYSHFRYTLIPELSLSRISRQQQALLVLGHITVNVTNVGAVDADEVVLGFISPPVGPGRPLQQLFDFSRVHLSAGQTATGDSARSCSPAASTSFRRPVSLPLPASSVSLVDERGVRYWIVCVCCVFIIVF